MKLRKCCGTPKGGGPHKIDCRQNPRRLAIRLGMLTAAEKIELLDEIADDLPDGAYFAMAEEMGIETEDFLDED